MTISRLLLCMLILTGCFTACKKDASPGNPNKRLKQMVTRDGDSLFYTTFHYDTGNRLIGYTSSNNTNIGYRWESSFRVDAQGNPVTLQTIRYNDQSKDSVLSEADSLVYEDNHPVKKLFYNYPSRVWLVSDTYSYNAQGNVSVDSSYGVNNVLWGYSSYTYDANNDIVQWESVPKRDGEHSNAITTTYNTRPNAYKALGNWIYFLGDFATGTKPTLLSQYNVTNIDLGTLYGSPDILSYEYQYNANGFISTIIITENDFGGKTSSSIAFYYE